MPFRQKLKATFRRSSTTPSNENSGNSSPTKPFRAPTEKEIEKWNRQNLPPSKYRRRVDPQHKQTLEAYSLDDAQDHRRNSGTSQYSPMGSKLPSRKNSSAGAGTQGHRKSDSMGAVGKVDENAEDDTDTANVGLSRKHTHDSQATEKLDKTETLRQPDTSMNPAIKLNSEQPFTQEELDLALQKSKSKPTTLSA